MLKLFIDTWTIQSLDWRILYAMSIIFLRGILYQFAKMIFISIRLKLIEAIEPVSDISIRLDEMYRKIDAGLDVRPSNYLK